MKPLSQIIEDREPEFIDYDENCTSVCDRASYDRMKQIAVELAKAAEFYANDANHIGENLSVVNCEEGAVAKHLITKCRELLGEK